MNINKLIIKDVEKKYKKNKVLKGISLNIESGVFGLLGPNGAGKTTLIRVLATVLKSNSGYIKYNDMLWSDCNDVRKLIGYLPQKFSLYKTVKVYEALKHISLLKGIKDVSVEVERVLKKVNLFEERNKLISELSGGMLRRVGIAQAIIGDPLLIIIDEPTAGLDPEERVRFRNIIAELNKESIVIISTHIVEDISATCSTLAIMKAGEIVISDTLKNITRYADNKIWEMKISKEELSNFSEKVQVISYQATDDSYVVRYISQQKNYNAVDVIPNLEDSYLYLLRGDMKI